MSIRRRLKMAIDEFHGEIRLNDVRIPIDKQLMTRSILKALSSRQGYEHFETQFTASLIEPGDVVLELGAGLGYLSSYLRKRTLAGRIVCVEANPGLIPYIENVHRINKISNVEVLHGVAHAGPTEGSVPFYCRAAFWSSSLDAKEAYLGVVQTPWLSFEGLLQKYRPKVLAIDIEGGELELLAGMQSLDPVRSITIELHPAIYGIKGARSVVANLERLGFEDMYMADSGGVRVFKRTLEAAASLKNEALVAACA